MKLKNLHKKTNKWVTRSAALLATVSLLATASAPLVAYAQDVYTVQAGDNLYRIAMDNGTTEAYLMACLLYTSPSPRDRQKSRMPSSA